MEPTQVKRKLDRATPYTTVNVPVETHHLLQAIARATDRKINAVMRILARQEYERLGLGASSPDDNGHEVENRVSA